MRQKVHVSRSMTDKELFAKMPLGDTWPDAEMVELWAYLFQNKKLIVPAGWQTIMDDFNQELKDSAAQLKTLPVASVSAEQYIPSTQAQNLA